MNFVAIDFETANEKRNSPCSLGITVVMSGHIVLEKYWLIRPKELRFNPMNIWIHGIRVSDVAHEQEFDALWPEILPYLEHNLVVAHNASFDISVLRHTLDTYHIPYPNFDYCCTMVMAKHFYPHLEDAKLGTVSAHLGHQFTHHHASSDATACANILLNISRELNTSSIQVLSNHIGVGIGKLYASGYTPSRSTKSGIVSKLPAASLQHAAQEQLGETTFFQDKVVAFTGPLSSMTRAKAICLMEQLGGDYSCSVTRKTNLVVTGIKNPHTLTRDQMSTKLRRAMDLIDKGQRIDFLNEEDFIALLFQRNTCLE